MKGKELMKEIPDIMLCDFDMTNYADVEEVSGRSSSRAAGTILEEKPVVGFDQEATKLAEQLMSTRKQLQVISIIGMAGIGKTTMARKLYNDLLIKHHFYVRAWTYVSQVYQKRELLLRILSDTCKLTDKVYEMSDDELSEKLWRSLSGKRYLIVLDDIWDIGAWHDLSRSFPDNMMGSRIVLTSRLTNTPLLSQTYSHLHHLRFLSQDESWVLLQQKVFQTESCPEELKKIAMQIIQKCRGLPLAIVVIAGVLRNERTPEWWRHVAQGVSSYIVGDSNQYMQTLELSYKHLPQHLKSCFLYFGAYPEDYEIPARKLIWLWLAEGFIPHVEGKILEEVAKEYLMDLISRSLVMVSKKDSNGGIKTCRIHDLLHELCLKKAKEQKLETQFLGINPPALNLITNISSKSSTGFVFVTVEVLRSFINRISWDTTIYKRSLCLARFLKALDIFSIRCKVFPHEVLLLINLRYFAFRAEDGTPPGLISDLAYLETLIISSSKSIIMPGSIWKVATLRRLYLKSGVNVIDPLFGLQPTNHTYPSELGNLHTLSFVCPSSSCERVLERSPNLRKVGFSGPLISDSGQLTFPDIGFSNHLENLKLFNTSSFIIRKATSCKRINFPTTLRRITLTNTALEWDQMRCLGMLPNLEVLKLKINACIGAFFGMQWEGSVWETSDGWFPQLKFLLLEYLDIMQWITSSHHFPRLQHLVLNGCPKLEEIPSDLGNISTLEFIEISSCSKSAVRSALEIQKEQHNMGNDWLKVLVKRH